MPDYKERRHRVAQSLVNREPEDGKRPPDLDCLLVTGSENVRYLSGFTGSNGAMLLFRDGRAIFYTDPRYKVQAARQVDCRVKVAKNYLMPAAMKDFDRSGAAELGIEKEHLTVGEFQALMKLLPTRAMAEPVEGHVEKLRMVKDEGEIDLIRSSVELNSQAFDAALKRFKAGMSEAELAAEIDYRSRKLGAERPSFDTLVAAGERAALPHAHPTEAKIGPGMLLIDMGAFRDGYASDMTRMAYVGKANAKFREAYKAVLEAQLAAIDAVRPGVTAMGVDLAARKVFKALGREKEFVHSTGHGLGLRSTSCPSSAAR